MRAASASTREFRASGRRQETGVFWKFSRRLATSRTRVHWVQEHRHTPSGCQPFRNQPRRAPRTYAGFQRQFLEDVAGGYDFRLSAKSEDKRGDRLWGRGGAAEFAAEPIDSNTRQVEAVLSYTKQALQLQGGYLGSWYTNRNSMVDTALTSGANPYFLSLPLDNQAHQLFVNGGYNFTKDTRGTFKVSYTRATQNEPYR